MYTIYLSNLLDSFLAGRPLGEAHFPILYSAILQCKPNQAVVLDFTGVTNITASYIAATIVKLLRLVQSGGIDRFFIGQGMDMRCLEEIAYVLNVEGTPMLMRDTGGNYKILGPLDESYKRTLDTIMAVGPVTARSLHDAMHERIGLTAWVKRLATLNSLGLVQRVKTGREFTYHPLFWEEQHG
jgi:hypothetical protein